VPPTYRSRDILSGGAGSWFETRGTIAGLAITSRREVLSAGQDGDYDTLTSSIQLAGPLGNSGVVVTQGWLDGALYTLNSISPELSASFLPPKLEFPADIGPGQTWSWRGFLQPLGPTYYSATALEVEPITVPAGTFDALHIQATGQDYFGLQLLDFTSDTWVAPGVGIARSRTYVGGQLVLEEELTSYQVVP
jgi:hypothetical protein